MSPQQLEEIKDNLISHFTSYAPITKEEADAIKADMDIRFFQKGELLLEEDSISEECYFIYKGCIRQYYSIDAEEKTTNFYTENQSVFFQESITNQTPCGFYLSCIEDCILIVGNEEKESALYSRFPQFANLAKLMIEESFSQQQALLTSFITDSPEQRYLNLMKNRPDLIQRVPQYQIASYIGIKPESLSRIRKRLVSKI